MTTAKAQSVLFPILMGKVCLTTCGRLSSKTSFATHGHQRYEHFFHGNATVLEGVLVVVDVVVIIVGIGEEIVVLSKDVGCADIRRRQGGSLGCFQLKDLLGVVAEILAQFVTQIGVCVLVTNHLDGVVHTDRAVVGGDDDVGIGLGKFLEKFADRRVVEPRSGDAAVGTLIARQFTHHARLSTSM